MMKAMISQPMAGKTDEEIIETRERATKILEKHGYKVIDTFFTDEWTNNEKLKEKGDIVQIPIYFLSKSLEAMSKCHAVYFCKGWKNARGCRIEHDAALAYGLNIIYEHENVVIRDPETIQTLDSTLVMRMKTMSDRCKGSIKKG